MKNRNQAAPKTKKGPKLCAWGLRSGDEWNRTTDTRIFSPLLYQLSYITGTV